MKDYSKRRLRKTSETQPTGQKTRLGRKKRKSDTGRRWKLEGWQTKKRCGRQSSRKKSGSGRRESVCGKEKSRKNRNSVSRGRPGRWPSNLRQSTKRSSENRDGKRCSLSG